MGNQVYFEDIEEGYEIPPVTKQPTTTSLVKWAGASEDFYPIHYDKDFAMANKLPGVIVHGRLKAAYLGNLITDWIGEEGTFRQLSCQYRGMDLPGAPLTCKGTVTKKYQTDGENILECQLWIENDKGEKTTPATAVVALPLRE